MVRLVLAANLELFSTQLGAISDNAQTVADVLREAFAECPQLGALIVDERGALRKHLAVCVNGQRISDPERLSDAVSPSSEVLICQALPAG